MAIAHPSVGRIQSLDIVIRNRLRLSSTILFFLPLHFLYYLIHFLGILSVYYFHSLFCIFAILFDALYAWLILYYTYDEIIYLVLYILKPK